MCLPSFKSKTLTTSINLLSCFIICSITESDPLVTIVILESVASSVGATVNDSILYPRAEKRPETLERAPDSFSINNEIMCRNYWSSSARIISDKPFPLGTMGNTFSD